MGDKAELVGNSFEPLRDRAKQVGDRAKPVGDREREGEREKQPLR